MSALFRTLLATMSLAVVTVGCSAPSDDTANAISKRSGELPAKFDWNAPARLNVVETISGIDSKLKIRYDVTVSTFASKKDQLLLKTEDVTPIEINGQQLDVDRLPFDVQKGLEKQLIDYHSRPDLVVNLDGELVSVEGLEDSVRSMAEINEIEQKDQFVKVTLDNPFMVNRIKTIATSVWDCWVTPWIDFDVPLNESVEQNVSLVILEGASPAAAKRTLTNHGFVDGSNSIVHLEQHTRAQGVELAQAMLNLSRKTMSDITGEQSHPVPDIAGIATARTVVRQQVKLDPKTMKPVWAKCSREFSVDSRDADLLPSRSDTKEAEYNIKWN